MGGRFEREAVTLELLAVKVDFPVFESVDFQCGCGITLVVNDEIEQMEGMPRRIEDYFATDRCPVCGTCY